MSAPQSPIRFPVSWRTNGNAPRLHWLTVDMPAVSAPDPQVAPERIRHDWIANPKKPYFHQVRENSVSRAGITAWYRDWRGLDQKRELQHGTPAFTRFLVRVREATVPSPLWRRAAARIGRLLP